MAHHRAGVDVHVAVRDGRGLRRRDDDGRRRVVARDRRADERRRRRGRGRGGRGRGRGGRVDDGLDHDDVAVERVRHEDVRARDGRARGGRRRRARVAGGGPEAEHVGVRVLLGRRRDRAADRGRDGRGDGLRRGGVDVRDEARRPRLGLLGLDVQTHVADERLAVLDGHAVLRADGRARFSKKKRNAGPRRELSPRSPSCETGRTPGSRARAPCGPPRAPRPSPPDRRSAARPPRSRGRDRGARAS